MNMGIDPAPSSKSYGEVESVFGYEATFLAMALRKLPIGIQDFVRLRHEGCLYVDKTAFVYKLVTEGSVYFLSRPRRFGKSLLLSTLGAYFEGKRELFHGLAIEKLEPDWTEYPVLRLDLNAEKYDSSEALVGILNRYVESWESRFPEGKLGRSIAERFLSVIERAHAQTGRRVVVLIDEYDKPLLSTIGKPALHESMKDTLKAFYGVLKSVDAHLKFAMLTGVTKFGQVSVFSDLNQPDDLSMHPAYGALCGITHEELLANFGPELERLAKTQNLSWDECIAEVRRMYNGYLFEENAPSVYNPFSTINALSKSKFGDYWFATGTPTFLVELLKKTDTDLREIDGVEVPATAFGDYRLDAVRPIPVIYQSGYLTIRSYNRTLGLYTLGYPNAEVRNGFLSFLLPDYTGQPADTGGFHIAKFSEELRAGDVDAFMLRLRAFFEKIPYDLNAQTERHYHVVFYLVFTLLGQFIESEVKSANGRADAVVKTQDTIFVFEFKLKGTAAVALKQIDDQGYLIPYTTDGRKVIKVGVAFDKKKRNIGRWLVG